LQDKGEKVTPVKEICDKCDGKFMTRSGDVTIAGVARRNVSEVALCPVKLDYGKEVPSDCQFKTEQVVSSGDTGVTTKPMRLTHIISYDIKPVIHKRKFPGDP
jgi:hypothetical protein